MRLLPQNKDLGWTPYAWLIYLASVPFYGYASGERSHAYWALTIFGMLILLALYFWGYWIKGKRLLWIVAANSLLGLIYSPTNVGASVYFIYAASFAAFTGEAAFAVQILGLILLLIGLETWIVHLTPYFWIPGDAFCSLIGAVNIHYKQRQQDTKKLLMAQEEVEHLAKIAERDRIARDLHDVLGHTL